MDHEHTSTHFFRFPSVLAVMLVYSLNCLTHVWGSTLLTLTLAPLRVTQSSVGMMTIASILASVTFSLCQLN